ncbi:hypothetical protein [Halobacteriovorax sp. HLS]|uniref:hypothetical protein n=1 Tax=Halobacteriovorax sp. HLS TaxID=2234000 RepID=UPI000FDCC03D|nr:hypothetical protein [Halobacteriovorax sp. HLS]
MNTYNMNYIADKNEYWVSCVQKQQYIVIFTDKSSAHQYKLALVLGNTLGPWDELENYELISSNDGKFYYKIKVVKQNDDWKDEACCQSGCPGCPWTLSQG